MGYANEPSNMAGGDKFLAQITEEDLRVLREDIPKLIEELKSSLHPNAIKIYNHQVTSKVISVTVDGGSQPVFPEIPSIGMGLIRVSSASDNLKKLPNEFEHIVRFRNLAPVFREDKDTLAKKRQAEMNALWETPRLQKFSQWTGITLEDIGTSFLNNPQAFMGIARDLVEWAYICYIVQQYDDIDIVVVKDGRLEQHGVSNAFLQKLRAFFHKHNAKVVGVIKSSKLMNGSNGISLLVIAEWIKHLEKQFYFKVPDELMKYVYLHERIWNPEHRTEEGDLAGFSFGHRYIGKMYARTFTPLEAMLNLDIPSYFEQDEQAARQIVGAIIANRCLLFGGSFAPTVEAHAKASISDFVRRTVQDHLIAETGFSYPFST